MPTVQAPVRLTVEHLLSAVKQLSTDELGEFTQQLAEWQKQTKSETSESMGERQSEISHSRAVDEAVLLASIEENSRLPASEQRHFDSLRRKRQAETLTTSEEAELQKLWQRVEQMNVQRLEGLTKLANQRATDVKTLMRELGLKENYEVF